MKISQKYEAYLDHLDEVEYQMMMDRLDNWERLILASTQARVESTEVMALVIEQLQKARSEIRALKKGADHRIEFLLHEFLGALQSEQKHLTESLHVKQRQGLARLKQALGLEEGESLRINYGQSEHKTE